MSNLNDSKPASVHRLSTHAQNLQQLIEAGQHFVRLADNRGGSDMACLVQQDVLQKILEIIPIRFERDLIERIQLDLWETATSSIPQEETGDDVGDAAQDD